MWVAVVTCILFIGGISPFGARAEEAAGGCEVVSFEPFEESQALLTPAGDYKVIAKRECANLTIRNISGSARVAGDFIAIAVFGKGNIAEGGFDLAGDDSKKRISSGETYNGTACLDDGSPIVIMNCTLK